MTKSARGYDIDIETIVAEHLADGEVARADGGWCGNTPLPHGVGGSNPQQWLRGAGVD